MAPAVADRLARNRGGGEHLILGVGGASIVTGNGRVTRLRRWLLALTIVVIAGAVAAPIIGSAIVERNEAETQLAVTCTSARANISQLEAIQTNGKILKRIARSLGLPIDVPPFPEIPEVPPECAGF